MIPGEGPIPCDVMLIGEMPGIEEMKYGRPFVGRAGGELNRYLNGYTCPLRQDLYLTNLKKRQKTGKDYIVSADELAALADEIRMVRPRVIVALGHNVTKYFCGNDATLEAYHGIPHPAVQNFDGMVFPAFNPAAVLHSPGLQSSLAYDMRRLGLYLKGKLSPPPIDEHAGQYSLLTGNEVLCVLNR